MECIAPKMDFAFEKFKYSKRPIWIARMALPAGFKSSCHKHDSPQLWYCYCGEYQHRVDGQVYHCKEGSMVVTPIGAEHQFWLEQDAELINLNFHYNILDGVKADEYLQFRTNILLPVYFEKLGLSFEPYKELSPQSRQVMEQAFSWLFLLDHSPHNLATEDQVLEKLEKMFSIPEFAIPKTAYKKAISITQSRLNPIMNILDYLNTHYPEKITDEHLLQTANLSRAVMYRHFKEIMNETYSRYLQHLRARHAHCLFRDAICTNAQIAELCGFYSTYHMAQTYERFFGINLNESRLHLERIYGNRQSD